MNFIKIAFFGLLFSPNAWSQQSLTVDMRGDLDSTQYNSTLKSSGSSDTSVFTLQTARIEAKGNVDESLSYRLRFRVNNDNDTTRGLDSLTSQVDFAALTKKIDSLALTLGKFTMDVGGFETISDSLNQYYKSEANKALTGSYTALGTTETFFRSAKYNTGAKISYSAAGSELALLAANSPEGDAQAAPKAQTRLFSGAVYKGKYLEKKLQVVASYHGLSSGSDNAAATSDSKATYLAGGLKWDDESFSTQLDFVNLKSGPLLIASVKNDLSIQSTVFDFTYKMGEWSPRLQVESSEVTQEPEGNTEVKRKMTGGAAIIEYRPITDKQMRYHAAFTQKTTAQESVADKVESHLILGFAVSADILK